MGAIDPMSAKAMHTVSSGVCRSINAQAFSKNRQESEHNTFYAVDGEQTVLGYASQLHLQLRQTAFSQVSEEGNYYLVFKNLAERSNLLLRISGLSLSMSFAPKT